MCLAQVCSFVKSFLHLRFAKMWYWVGLDIFFLPICFYSQDFFYLFFSSYLLFLFYNLTHLIPHSLDRTTSYLILLFLHCDSLKNKSREYRKEGEYPTSLCYNPFPGQCVSNPHLSPPLPQVGEVGQIIIDRCISAYIHNMHAIKVNRTVWRASL